MAARVLVIGSGGREHTLAWKLAQSPRVKQVLVAPGNAGTACLEKISNTAISVGDHTALAQFCKDEKVAFVVVGPEAPLAAGIVGDLASAGVRCFGPTAEAAQLESSKRFAKEFMDRHRIPTAQWRAFTKAEKACSFIMSADFPALVVKASGLAAGKGVIVAKSKEEACKAVQEIMQEKTFGAAGETVVVEELLEGEEVSCLCFTDGRTVVPMPPAQDHKRLLEGDLGPNTGGMGAYCPAPQISKDLLLKIKNTILQRTVDGMQQEGTPYTGILYAGIMLTKDGPKVLEFNCRFGDPECQVILPLLKSDLYEVIQSTLDGLLCSSLPSWLENHTAVTVVMASKGYPGAYTKGMEITGIPEAQALGLEVFHAGTALKDGKVVTSGGRVLTVTAIRENLKSALEEAKKGLATIKFEGAVYRKDIGFHAIAFLQQPRGLTYKDSGVDIAAGNMLVKKIQPLAKATSRPGCDVDLGGFAGLFDLKAAGFKDPLLASGTDGVGTKLKIAQLCNKHSTIGQDLVAMCVNDILAQGAEPLFFLDYFSCGKLDLRTTEAVVAGVAEACKQAGCALLGGETAEMPDMYPPGEYDLAGFAVGGMERYQKLPHLEQIVEGDVVVGIASSGLHSNGFSLVRKIVAQSSLEYSSLAPGGCGDQTLGDLLLTPTRIYSRSLLPVIRSGLVKAFAHITGGGLLENIPRVLPKKFGVDLDARTWRIPRVFSWLQQEGQLSEEEMARTFNCGVGAALVVSKDQTDHILREIQQRQEEAWVIGSVVACPEGSPRVKVKNLIETMQINESVLVNGSLETHFPAQQKKARVAVLISGTGSNLQALIDSTQDPNSAAHIVVVISNKPAVAGLNKAEKAGIPTRVINHKLYKNREEFDGAIDQVLEEFATDIVCLAGFMRILSGPFVRKWDGKMLNIHPSLLPSFKGSNAHEQVLEAGVTITGCTVHFVAEDVDAGQIILQEAVPVKRGDTVATLSEKVKVAEHKIFPKALQLVASGTIWLGENNKVCWVKEE
ncbi:Trifunctional purine biosynthetic protein adenosine-3 [Heterocephalus glaber]|uniref:Trifunctional purine biosynthetic protein adenosine-3 n=1 Tax=Heterocephalus glaber TaxID=10181 RepID=G5BE86_HETGA|nr:trifunctional purine biosynthetic protein adenosine-3 isoform X1 [Heterocephalus glaber]XP_004842379.1 trifunctional purine biosynthetic protein adenosine-3 isoform X1 [Heterocephalus glaber]XP_004842380.1 trifunctional purine biosynthetic protein adenosine-3 isoform X1 [Heterocephalus glaber]XP_021111858.1 trifunctional purine biosynthetic protein adenosine-3 isoform X1 [Heterocephalus glaber]EHB07597.1 Trifunctional purine biosynthetic protein adenosine-3 [Heterocephalus glaber]